MSPLFPILTTNPAPSNLFYILWPDPASKYTSDHIIVSLQNSKCKSLSSEKKSILLTQVSEVLRNVVPTSPSVLFPTDALPLESVRAHHSLNGHTFHSLSNCSSCSSVCSSYTPKFFYQSLLTPQGTFPMLYFPERSGSRYFWTWNM